jgi:MFS family permease
MAAQLKGRSDAWRLGASATAAIGVLLLAWAISTDFVKQSSGAFFSDGATYYEMAHSLAGDFDLAYRRDDLVRVWREFPGGPEGLFLKRGRDVDVGLSGSFPFVTVTSREDPDRSRLYFGKSFIFPLFAAPFVFVFGTNGFLVLHAVLMTLCFLCAYAFLVARSHPLAALIFAAAFLFVCVAPVYMVQLMPDFFNMAMVLIAYFFWCYKEVVGPDASGRSRRMRVLWLLSARSDVVCAVLLGIATFSKPTNALLVFPMLASALLRRQWRRAGIIGGVFGAVVAGLFACNVAITGDWNYQGGDRRTFYSAEGGYPFQSDQHGFDTIGIDRTTNRLAVEVLTSRDAIVEVFRHNLAYFFIGRHTGFAWYYLPGLMAILLFLAATRDRALWQWLTLATGLGSAVALLLYMPYSYSGGGGPVGNRYFVGTYPVFLFIVPPLQTAVAGLLTMALSAMFTAPLLSNPFYASFHPAEHSKVGLFRWMPTELTMVNDLPVNVNPSRTRQPLSGSPPMFGYFMDDNVYNREGDAFWVRGESHADIMLRAPISVETTADVSPTRSLRIESLTVHLETGPRPNRVTLSTGGETRVVEMAASSQQSFDIAMPRGVPYRPDPRYPTNYVYMVSIENDTGFIPMFEIGGHDRRFLGVYVRLVPHYGGQP